MYFYEDDAFLIDNVAHFVEQGLKQQETVIVVATEQHDGDLKEKLLDEMISLSALRGASYVTLDASATLSQFMRKGWPDERMFLKVICGDQCKRQKLVEKNLLSNFFLSK